MSTLNNNERPTFGANVNGANTEEATKLAEQRKQRPEVGAIWKKSSTTTNMDYMTIRLRVTKEKLQELLSKPTNENGEVDLNLVAFPNKSQQGIDRRPSFRIYEELVNPTR